MGYGADGHGYWTMRFKILMTRENGEVVAQASKEYAVYRPKPTWVELDLDEIWKSILVYELKMARTQDMNEHI